MFRFLKPKPDPAPEPAATAPWVDTDLNMREVRVTPVQIEEFRASRMWIHLVQACLHKRQKMIQAARNPELTDRQSALALGFTEGIDWVLSIPGFVATQPVRDESQERSRDEAALEKILEMKGLIHVRRTD